MKRIMIAMTILLAAVCFAQTSEVDSLCISPKGNEKWQKTKDNVWPGQVNGEVYFYKLDKGAKLLWSADGKSWDTDADGMWADKEGNFMKIDGGKVMWSPDGANTWQDTPEWKWQAVDEKWYKLDKDWNVWVSPGSAGKSAAKKQK
jgi:hypothetical protein